MIKYKTPKITTAFLSKKIIIDATDNVKINEHEIVTPIIIIRTMDSIRISDIMDFSLEKAINNIANSINIGIKIKLLMYFLFDRIKNMANNIAMVDNGDEIPVSAGIVPHKRGHTYPADILEDVTKKLSIKKLIISISSVIPVAASLKFALVKFCDE